MKNLSRNILIVSLTLASSLGSTRAQDDKAIRDSDIKVIDYAELTYPSIARHANIQGVLVLRASLDDHGKVVDASVISGAEAFRLDTLDNIRKWRFEPNLHKSAVVIYNFSLLEGRCKSDSSLFVLQGKNLATVMSCPAAVDISTDR